MADLLSRRQRALRVERLESRRMLAAQLVNVDASIELTQMWTDVRQLSDYQFAQSSTFRFHDPLRFALHRPLLEQQIKQTATVTLPDDDGRLQTFAVEPSEVMSAELASKFPAIESYAGRGIDDPTATLRLDLSPAGLRAQVLSVDGGFLIDPYYHLNDSIYAVYRRDGDADRPDVNLMPHEETPQPTQRLQAVAGSSASPAQRSGTQLRTYRAAIAATGEFTAFHGGTVELGQAAIVAALNRINGIYENELAIRMQLVADNDQLVYTNPGSDPYDNNDFTAILPQNQTNVDNVIGSANYDVGHVFVTAGGGLAFLGVVGNPSFKARGVSGLNSPTGDSFWVDIVAHEFGHQFGAEHTWTGDSNSCSPGSFAADSAMEPGSGSTIMAYPGICGNDNLQNSSDPFFHSISFDEIIEYVDNDIPAVGTRTVTGNQVPTADAGPDFTIPARTPFALTGTAGDADADDVLVYSWEQRDAGPRQDIGAGDTGNNPLFRVFPPTDDPVRTFPKLESLLQNTTTIGETLPVRTRTMNFRFVVRDNRAGGGAVNTDDMVINVVNTGTPFSVIGPDGGESFAPVSLQTVDWHVGGTNANGIDAANVNIRLSLDGGYTFPILLAKNVPNDGNHSVVMPDVNTASARIKVEGAGNVFFDVSNADFTIGTPPSLVCSVFEHFDSVVAPALPAQWTTASSGAVPDWAIAGAGSDTTPNHAFVSNPSNTGESTLTSPTVNGPERIRFRNFYQTESNFDGGVLEVSSDGINFSDIIAAGGSFVSGGYNSTIAFTNTPLAGRNAWSGNSGDYLVTEVALPSDLVGQQIQFRWRMGTDQAVGAIGWRIDSIDLCDPPPPEFDFGDAPDPDYPTLQSNSGAAHRLGGTLFLGTSVDSDADGQPNATASGDDEDGSDDEHAVIIPASLTGGETVSIPVVASTNYGLLNAWIDFNSDGDWDDAGEQIFVDEPLISGVNQPEFTVPVAVTPGTSYARFRLSTVGGLSPRGVGVDGEVEDYQVTLQPAEAPTVIDVSVNEGAETRSELTQVTVTFNRPVTTPDSAFELFQRGTNTPVNSLIVNASVNANDQTVVQLTFGADPLVVTRNLGNTLDNGEYQLTIIATMISRLDGGGSMAANYHFGDQAADKFFRKYGDDNGNNLVDLVDFARFRASFGEGSAGAGYVRAFDSDNDSAIGLLDFAQFRAGFGT